MTQARRTSVNHIVKTLSRAQSLVDLAHYQKETQKLISMILRIGTDINKAQDELQRLKDKV